MEGRSSEPGYSSTNSRHKLVSARRLAGASAAALGGLCLWSARVDPSEQPESTARSIAIVLQSLTAGLAGSLHRVDPAARPAVLARAVRDASSGLAVHLCGVSHVDPASATAVRAYAEALAAAPGGLGAVAVEDEPRALLLTRAARAALHGLPPERIRAEGEGLVRHALFGLAEVHAWAAEAGATLDGAERVPLSPTLARQLRGGGVGAHASADASSASAVGTCVAKASCGASSRRAAPLATGVGTRCRDAGCCGRPGEVLWAAR